MGFVQPVPGVPGAEIREVPFLPVTLENAVRVGPYSVARTGALLRVVPGVGRFLALEGREIQMVRDFGASPLDVDQFLFGAVRSALILQRGGFPLHGACLVPPRTGHAVAIAGPPGAGKSTLAVELVRRGWLLLGDDLTALYKDVDGGILAWPSGPGIKLWRDACLRIGEEPGELERIPGERDKYMLPAATREQPARLKAIVELDRSCSGGIVPVLGPERLAFLLANTFRPKYLRPLGCVASHFELSCHIAESVTLCRLRNTGAVESCADLLECFSL